MDNRYKVQKSFTVVCGYGDEIKSFSSESEAIVFAAALNNAYNSGKERGAQDARSKKEVQAEY